MTGRIQMGPLPGETLGHYQIVGRLGSGGTGEVYRATDLRLRRDVALKILRIGTRTNAEAHEWLQKEARVASSLNHPNIVTIHDVGATDVTPYIAMEFVEGMTLRDLLSAGLPRLDRVPGIGEQIADGLAKAHEAGIVHRDLKPENLMLTEDGLVKILDFGVAKSSGEEALDVSDYATPNSDSLPFAGTVGYMSPEQVRGKPIDYRSDQFSLGIILYEMIAGTRPFQRSTALQTLAAIVEEEHESLCGVRADVPGSLSMLVDRCLSKTPEGRYSSTRELASQLRAVKDEIERTVSRNALPVVAVMPFADLSPDKSCGFFCEGIAEEVQSQLHAASIVTLLRRFAMPQPFAAKTRADMLVAGSVRRCGRQARIAAALIDARSGHCLWSCQYDRKFHNIFGIQTSIASRIVFALTATLFK